MNRHEVYVFENGTASIRDLEAGETMHSQVGPEEEARKVYIEQSRFAERLQSRAPQSDESPLVLYDVGMGIASNALAAIELATSLGSTSRRPLQIVSFENTLEGLKLSLSSESAPFPVQNRHREKLDALIQNHLWNSEDGKIQWELRFGDFLDQELIPEPEVIFYDFYSPKAAPQLWTYRGFKRLFDACERRRQLGQSTLLTTYSAATFVRSALLLAGFYVGYGEKTALKSETTLAVTQLKELERPLSQSWLERLARSSKPLPLDVTSSEGEQALVRIRSSNQFSLR
jgi:tRNA U34 5-methylaminomethyl-2-thiouridine-forming methyltransferase MnmC